MVENNIYSNWNTVSWYFESLMLVSKKMAVTVRWLHIVWLYSLFWSISSCTKDEESTTKTINKIELCGITALSSVFFGDKLQNIHEFKTTYFIWHNYQLWIGIIIVWDFIIVSHELYRTRSLHNSMNIQFWSCSQDPLLNVVF